MDKGDIVRIESRKHDGRLHRVWKKSVVLSPDEPLILANYDVEVIESDGQEWVSPGLAICQFHRNEWFHTILLFDEREKPCRYYTNIASPCQVKNSVITYIDYDLDMIADVHLRYRWVDQEEFEANRRNMRYPKNVVSEVERAVKRLEERIRRRQTPFTPSFVRQWYHQYLLFQEKIR
jgi:uncharacterized protein